MQQLLRRSTPTPEDYAFSRLIAYAAYQWPGYKPSQHHRLIARHLEMVERGEITRLMISMPPRHGKSMLASEFFPAWYLGRNPTHSVIAATYAQELADDFGRKVRDQIADPGFQSIFPGCTLKGDSQSSKRFHIAQCDERGNTLTTDQDGAYFASGIGGPLTGRGAHLLLIDDPVKNREEADSETLRRRNKEWYTSTAYTRLMPGGKVIIIQTRWHEDDLSGWLRAEHEQEGWMVLSLPALAEEDDALGRKPGESLWPAAYATESLHRIRQAVGSRDWSALYQQRPVPEDGDFFRREWIRFYETPPKHLRYYGASDYAVTDAGGDYTVHMVAGVDPNDDIYITDLWREQTDSLTWVETLIEMIQIFKPLQWAEEKGQILRSLDPLITKRQTETKAFCYRQQFSSTTDKATRAQAIRGRMAQGKVYFPKNKPWVDKLVTELLQFPAGKHDDQVDALSLIGRMLAEMVKADSPKIPPTPRFERTINELLEEQIKRKRREEDDN